MELDELHVHQGRAGPIGHAHPVTGVDYGVRAGEIEPATAAGRQYYRLRSDRVQTSVQDIPSDHAPAEPVLYDQCRDVPLFVDEDIALHQLLIHRVQNRVSGPVCRVARPRKPRAAKRPLRDATVGGAAENDTHALEFQNIRRRLATHRFDAVLIAQP